VGRGIADMGIRDSDQVARGLLGEPSAARGGM
jgi:hypothetical protein